MINFYHRLDNSFFACLLSSWTKVKDLFQVSMRDSSLRSEWQERLFVFLIHTLCFFCSVCRILCVSVDIWLNIRGYFITYPWIFHYVSTVTQSFCFVFAVYWLYVFVFSHIAVLFDSRESREKREDFFHRWIFGLTQISRNGLHRRKLAACRPSRVLSAGWHIRA